MNDALAAIRDYYKAFSTLELNACLPFFTQPCMFVGLQGTFAVANQEDLARVLGPIVETLRTKDYQRSEFLQTKLTTVTENAALVRGVAVRYRVSGTELERVPVSYLMYQVGDVWKIAVELFDILAGMIEPFHNLHTYIDAPDLKREFHTYRSGTDRVVKGDRHEFRTKTMPALLAITDRAYLQTPLRKWCNDQVQYAHINESTGYLRILSFSGYSKERGFANGLTALQTALDEIFSDPKLKALVIDVRINFGGDDGYGLEIASRLATADYLAYTKLARADPVDRNKWTPEDRSMVHPSARPGFRGPVVELIGP